MGPNSKRPRDYARFSVVAGELTDPTPGAEYRVQFRRPGEWRRVRTWLLVLIALMFIGGFFVWLMLPGHWHASAHHGLLRVTAIVMIVNTGIIGLFAFINLCTLCRASLLAHDPVPVHPESGTRIAFLTTIVPSREPFDMVRRTLEAALRVRHEARSTCGCSTRETTRRYARAAARWAYTTSPAGRREMEPAGRHVQGAQQARQLQRLAVRARLGVRLLHLRRSRPRADRQHG